MVEVVAYRLLLLVLVPRLRDVVVLLLLFPNTAVNVSELLLLLQLRATCVLCNVVSTSTPPSPGAGAGEDTTVDVDGIGGCVPGTTFLHGCKKGAKYINVALICVAVAIIAACAVAVAVATDEDVLACFEF